MIKKFLFPSLLLLLTFQVYSQRILSSIQCSIPKLTSEDVVTISGEQNIITTLYQGQWSSQNECVWKPNYEERLNMGLSDNGFLYSKLEEQFTYKTDYSEVILLIVGTYTKTDNEYNDCFACSPAIGIIKLEKYNGNDNVYKVSSFRKNVTSYSTEYGGGGFGGIRLIYLGKDIYILEASQSASKGGCNNTTTTLLSTDGDLLLSYESGADNEGAVEGDSGLYKNETKMFIDKNKGIITFHKKGTDIQYSKDLSTSKIVPVNKISKYMVTEYGTLEAISN